VNVAFLGADLQRWDQALREDGARPLVLGLPFFQDERPLRGAAGLCDWRLGGRLSRLLGAEGSARVAGGLGEQLLMPGGRRLPWERIVLYGLGPSARFDDRVARSAARGLLRTLCALAPPTVEQREASEGVSDPPTVALVPPGRSTGALSARQALELLLQEAAGVFADRRAPHLVIVESAAGQKEAAELARRHA
jgi:hypothetical protein